MLLITVIVIAMGAVMTFKGIISIGTLVAFQALMAGSSAAVYGLTSVLPFLVDATTSARRIEEVLSATSEVVDRSEANPLPRVASEIRFRNVSFGYSHAQRVVENINLQIRHGWSVALVGPSGCGKSTILNLVQRFYDPDRGAVLIDGQDIREVRQQDLHARISAVFQDNFLFNLSISDNIRMGKLDASDEEIIAAAKLAEAHDFIVELGEGYQTMAGDQGSHLSGGQRQRIAIARAIIRDPAILVLDEATSALDPATEASISKTIEKLRPGRTIICVTHRLSPIVNCDRIYVFEKGRLVESGSHAELLNAKNLYARLWEKQSGFTIDDEGLVTVTPQRLRQIPLLSMLDERQLAKLSRFLVSEKFAEGREIIRQNEEGDKFYLIVRGRAMVKYCDVAGRETLLATLCDGDHFGEIALLRNIPRTASVISQTPLIALSLARQPFHALLDQSPRLKEKLAQDVVNRIMVNDLMANCSPASPAEAPAASQPIYAGA
jgi:ATP-binding cassette subfamily B protein